MSEAPPSALPGISPSRGGDCAFASLRPQSPMLKDEVRRCGQPISPLEGEMPGRTEGAP
ncbi:MAG: lytic murein transglycosylase [Mesorhizobium sp.]|nr:MAG: lytic murein transglycosylase [Mesorhizobium sp.]